MNKIEKIEYFDSAAIQRDKWRKKGKYYHREMDRYLNFLIPADASVLQVGCGTGDTLASLKSTKKLGLDFSWKMIGIARKKFPECKFEMDDLDNLSEDETFDYILLVNVIGHLEDIQKGLGNLKKVCHKDTRIIIVYFNYLWEPVLKFAENIGLRMKRPVQHWLSLTDIENILELNDFEVVKKGYRFLIPLYIPLLSSFLNKVLINLPFINKFALNEIVVARPLGLKENKSEFSCSVVIPCRNEKGNIEEIVRRIPKIGSHTEIIFVEGHSTDGTLEECCRVQKSYQDKDIKVIVQENIGKRDAVYKGFSVAKGDIFLILDADMTVIPEDLPKFYEVLVKGKGDLIIGSRLIYQMEKQAMRHLNLLGNKFFSMAFSYLLEQRIKDTLCGTKVLWKKDYENIKSGQNYFGDFDPFGDFDLLFGASKLNLKIVEIPVKYHERKYGTTQIDRFRHGWLLLKMTFFAAKKIKFI